MHLFEPYISDLKKISITDLTIDSRQTNAQTAFIAIPGTQKHGLDFIEQALANKTPCVIIDSNDPVLALHCNNNQLPFVKIPGLIQHLGDFAATFYDHPSRKLKVHAITGTNGKTSCSQFIAQALTLLGEKCGVIGTLGIGIYPDLIENVNTTPDAVQLQRFFSYCVKNNVKHISMEASSIALITGRLQGSRIATAMFTNLTQDHLDFHSNMENYGAAKRLLFQFPGLANAIINADDAFGQQLLNDFAKTLPCIAYSINPSATVTCDRIVTQCFSLSTQGMLASLKITYGQSCYELNINSHLLGDFNLSNLLAIIAWLTTQNISQENIIRIISQIKAIPGRMQHLSTAKKPTIIVDYAHTPDALAQALKALRAHCHGKLWCVFGCGGNRDKTKRPLMGKIAEDLADFAVVTNDNPRLESPEDIAEQILTSMKKHNHHVELNRAKAIEYAIQHTTSADIILIAGKGHENYQDIQGVKHYFNDIETAENILANFPL